MPRGARLDAPGTLHHVMVRGIEGKGIVMDDDDREFFVSRMGMLAQNTGTLIFAWALMSNHAHILLKSGESGLAGFMRKLLTVYATRYNRRHQRQGHLFQNRYKSIICEEEPYFLRLVSYIHLNPLRAGMLQSFDELNAYPWSGHSALMNRSGHEWQERATVLQHFGKNEGAARKAYLAFVEEESGKGRQPELTGGGLIRSTGGWSEVKSLRKRGEKQFSDARILGSGDFVREILTGAEDSVRNRVPAETNRKSAEEKLQRACQKAGVSPGLLQSGSRRHECSALRSRLALMFVLEDGLSYSETAGMLGVSRSAVHQILRRKG